MKRWFWGFVTGVFMTFALLFLGGLLGWYLRQRPPEVANKTTLILDLQGEIPEQTPADISGQIFGEAEQATFLSVLQNIEKAGADSRIQAILIKPSNLQIGWAKLQQLHRALDQFAGRGKKVLAVLGVAGSREYFLASAAGRIYLSPVGFLNVKGIRSEIMFFKDALAKIGVQADLEHIGRYKNFSDQFTDNRMSDAFREATESLMDSIYGQFIHTVAAARHKPAEELKAIIEQTGPFEAERARDAGLVDQLLYEDEIFEQLPKEGSAKKPAKITLAEYRRVPAESVGLGGGTRIAMLYAVGNITSGEDEYDPVLLGKMLGSRTMSSVIQSIEEDESIKAVLLRIDSPGGDAFASEEIWREMVRLRKKKPLVISMSDEAASGGYDIAMTGDPIVAEPGTITGSIGIVYGKLNLKGLYDKLGIHKDILSRGKFSGMDSDYGPYTAEERERVRALMEDFYKKFVSKVATARKMTPEQVDALAQGRVWTGEQAKANGLIDDVGGLTRALEIVKQKAGIAKDARVELVEYPKKRSLFELLLSRAQMEQPRLPAGWSQWDRVVERIEKLSQRPLWARVPYALDIR